MDATYPTYVDIADDATACAFFWTGLALGILHVDAGREWAFARIDARDTPAIEIIEIATARDRDAAMEALQAATPTRPFSLNQATLSTNANVLLGEKIRISDQRPRRLIPIPDPERVPVVRVHDRREHITLFEVAA